jgi:hypothetical protein
MRSTTRRSLRGGLALCALALLCGAASASAVPLEEAKGSGDRVAVRLVTEAAEGEASATLALRIPLVGHRAARVERLRAAEAGFTAGYRLALVDALAAGIRPDKRAAQLAGDVVGLPRLRIEDGTAELEVDLHPFSFWKEEKGGRLLTLWRIEAPDDGRLEVVLRTRDAPLSASPLPDRDDGEGELRWVAPPGSPPAIQVRLDEPISPDYDRWPLRYASGFVAGGLPFALLIALLGWRRREAADLLPLAVAGVALAVAGVLFYAFEAQATNWDTADYRFTRALIPALGTVPFVALAWRRRDLAFVLAAGLAAAFAALIGTHEAFSIERQGELDDTLGEIAAQARYLVRSDAALIAACVVAVLSTAAVLAAVLRWLARLRDRPPGEGGGTQPGRRTIAIVAAVIVAAAAAIFSQLVLSARSSDDFASLFNEEPPWSGPLGMLLDFFPFFLANLARNLSLTLLSLALATWLWRRATRRELAFGSWAECIVLGLLFATAVTGTGGEVDGYAVPIPFLFSVSGVAVGARVLSRAARGRRATEARSEAATKGLLDDAARLALDRRRRHALKDRLIAGEIDEEGFQDGKRELDQRRDALGAAEALAAAGSSWPREALALGLASTVSARARLEALLRDGWPIVLLPVAYTVYALLDLRAGALTGDEPLGAAFLVSALADQVLMWPLVAWCFVVAQPILPGRIGPLKGLAAGLFSAVPFALASLVLDDPIGREQWLFLSAELTLFLVVIGVFLDLRAVRATGRDLRDLGDLYNVTSARATLAYVAPLALLLFGVIRGLASGEGASALEELVSNAESILPPGS